VHVSISDAIPWRNLRGERAAASVRSVELGVLDAPSGSSMADNSMAPSLLLGDGI
jgi:hypothetical protein